MKKSLILCLNLFVIITAYSQSVGDTIRVKAFDFNSTVRDTLIEFPSNPNLSFEKILLKYTMRCEDAMVNPGDNSTGCGEWDFSCNTYVVDSTKVETIATSIPSHLIVNYDDSQTVFPYKETPVYNYLRSTQTEVEITATNSEAAISIGSGTDESNAVLSTANASGKSHFLYTAEELIAAGMTAGDLEALSINILGNAGEAKYLKIKLKHSTKAPLDGQIDFDDFQEVYHNNTYLVSNELNRFHFNTPFTWDGVSNILVELNFSNIDAGPASETLIEGTLSNEKMSLLSTNGQEILLTGDTYVECNEYTGITGSENRTIEAWVKTTEGIDGEICGWGVLATGAKWVFRFEQGRLRVEISNGSVEGTTLVNDGKWHHVVCVLDGETLEGLTFYVDGVLDPVLTESTTAVNTLASPLRISRGTNTRYLNASVDDVRIWNTNLSEATINEWKSLQLDDTHPNYSNLQLHYEFNETGAEIIDSSINNRNATIIGQEYRSSELDGNALVKDFEYSSFRPNITFYQGDYTTNVTTTVVDKPIVKDDHFFVVTRSIIEEDPTAPFSDTVVNSDPIEYWGLDQTIFDETTGAIIEENTLTADGEITIEDLDYFERYPFYNELVSFVTPYGFFLDLGLEGKTWYMDMSDYVTVLEGEKRIVMTLGGQWQEEMDLEFLFIVGTPPREVLQYEQIWQGTNRRGIAHIDSILDESRFTATDIVLENSASTFKLKSSITGHGQEGEFHQLGGEIDHKILVGGSEVFNWNITRECSFNPIFPQGGTWIYDRQGWCPGERSLLNEQDLTPYATPGTSINIDYLTSEPVSLTGGNSYTYHVAHQLVGYGEANFQLDAAVTNILAPNNLAEYTRTGTTCKSPTLIIKNTGATNLESLTITYWINESNAPQTYEWTGNLGFMEEETVELPYIPALWFDILAEGNVFYTQISTPNGGSDEYAYNNKMSSTFDVPEVLPNNISIQFNTNASPADNSYQVFDSADIVILSNDLPEANTEYIDNLDLTEEECYKLVVEDIGGDGGDGIEWWANPDQGAGSINLLDGGGEIIKTFEPDFGGGFEYSFTTSFFTLSVEDLEFLTSIDVFPNPTSDYFSLQTSDLSDAEIHVTDLTGKTVKAPIITHTNETISVDVNHLSTGVYLVVINKGRLSTTRKIIVE